MRIRPDIYCLFAPAKTSIRFKQTGKVRPRTAKKWENRIMRDTQVRECKNHSLLPHSVFKKKGLEGMIGGEGKWMYCRFCRCASFFPAEQV